MSSWTFGAQLWPLYWNFDLKFCPSIGLMTLRISRKFQPKRIFFCRDIEFSSKLDFCGKRLGFENSISRQKTIRFEWNFQDILRVIKPIYGQNSVIWFFGIYLNISRKFSKMVITRLQRPLRTNLFMLSIIPTNGPNMSLKAFNQLVGFPRKSKIQDLICAIY